MLTVAELKQAIMVNANLLFDVSNVDCLEVALAARKTDHDSISRWCLLVYKKTGSSKWSLLAKGREVENDNAWHPVLRGLVDVTAEAVGQKYTSVSGLAKQGEHLEVVTQ